MATILVVDDEEETRDLLNFDLKFAGYDVVLAEDAIAAGNLVLERMPDLIVSKVDMPYMSGIELAAALRGDESIPRIPIILLAPSEDGREQAAALAIEAYEVKPVEAARILELVKAHLAQVNGAYGGGGIE